MLEIKEKKECTGCSACFSICPTKAISMLEDEEGFIYPKIDENKCIKCGACEKICPCIKQIKNTNFKKPKMLASWSLNEENRRTSSSGGCFFEIAKDIINQGGIVVGSAFDDELNVVHKIVDCIEALDKLKGSKYVQSKIGNCYIQTREHLNNGKMVFFVGTPCQIAGLYEFLRGKEYDNLYTSDIICHGVPSNKVYRKYLEEQEGKYNSKIKNISFRNKTYGWKKFSMKIDFENKKTYIKTLNSDLYMRAFLSDICLRPSCYECKFAKLPRVADITLGDFWGVYNINSKLDDDKGTSELVINSKKGEELLEKIRDKLYIEELELEDGIKENPCLVGSVKIPENREKFFIDLDKLTLSKLEKKYFPKKISVIKFLRRVKNKVYRIIKK